MPGAIDGPAAAGELAKDVKAKVLKVPKDHECAYTVMYAAGKKSTDPDTKLDLKPESSANMSKQARQTVCRQAAKMYNKDKPGFETQHGQYATFMSRLLNEKRGSGTWAKFPEWTLFTEDDEYKNDRIQTQAASEGE